MVAVFKMPTPDMRVHMVRLYNPKTRQYLHMGANHETSDKFYAWRGFRYQADELRARFIEDNPGQEWPYEKDDEPDERGTNH